MQTGVSLKPIDYLLDRLRGIRSLNFRAESHSETGWIGAGIGEVRVAEPIPGTLLFHEAGSWQPATGAAIRFTNTYRWSQQGEALRLEHLRFGLDQPVFLFDMCYTELGWRNTAPHHCVADCYSASLVLEPNQILLDWTIKGPRKNESISYTYW